MSETNVDNQLLRQHVQSGNNAEVMSLLEGADPCHFVGQYKSTLLHLAAEYGNKDLAQYLVDLGAHVDVQNNIGETPLVLAVKNDHKEVVKILLKAEADIYVPDIFGRSVLGRALDKMKKMRHSIRKLLLSNNTVESIRKSRCTWTRAFHEEFPLHNFVSRKDTEMIRLLLERGSPVNARVHGRTALLEAVRHKAVDIVKLLVEYGANVYDYYNNPLDLICNIDDDETLEMVQILLNANSTLITSYPMLSLLSRGGRKLVRTVSESQADLFKRNRVSEMPIDYIFENKDPAIYQELKNLDIDFKVRFDDNTNLLHRVAGKGNPIAVKFLIDRGVNVNAKDDKNLTPLHVAINPFTYEEKTERVDYWIRDVSNCIAVLLYRGADPQVFTRDIAPEHFSDFDVESAKEVADALMKPVLVQLALQEAGGRVIDEFMLDQIHRREGFESVFDSCRRELEAMKRVELDESVTLFDFLIDGRTWMFAGNDVIVANLTRVMDGYDVDSNYYDKLQNCFLKLCRLYTINQVFVRCYNVSAMDIAENIVSYL